jgi:hypothetical protein
VKVTIASAPAAPTLTAPASSTTGSYTVSWSSPSGASSYRLEEQVNGGGWQEIQAGGATSLAINGKPNGTYGYRVRACSTTTVASCGGYSNTVTVVVTIGSIPPIPTLSAPATSTTGSYTVSWTNATGAVAYRLEEQSNGGAWAEIQNAASTSRAISGKPNGTYGYRVRACSSTTVASCSAYSNIVQVTVTVAQVPAAPTLTGPISGSTDFEFTLNWSAPTGATSYQLEQSRNGLAWSVVYSGAANSHTRQVGLGGSYAYRVSACSSLGCSPYSAIHTIAVSGPTGQPPGVPVLTAPALNSTGTYTVSWTAPSGATTFRLEEQTNGGGWAEIQVGSGTSRTVTGKGTGSYGYRVSACSSTFPVDCGAYSNVATVSVTINTQPAPPVVSAPASSSTGSYTVSWTAPSGATFYRLEERINSGPWAELQASSSNSIGITGRGTATYSYRVSACSSAAPADCGGFSGVVSVVVTIAGGEIPATPSISGPSSANSSPGFDINWSASSGATRYELDRNRNGGTWSTVYSGAATSSTQIVGVAVGATANFGYRVRACSAAGCSANSPTHTVLVTGSGN